ncbi:hypothetical protein [Snodgrassella gandavensis]|uniref:hypothetical protein n=1 Tax=Snodgrassella gandavensis TaxID=2946698 RepID=UPI001EF4FFC3|nr:hypothetical protein [Snodgrassella gandavensis]
MANAIGAFIIIILKVIHQGLLLKRGYTAFASKPTAWLTSKKVDTDKLSNKNLLIRAAICLFVVTCNNILINKGIIIPNFKGNLIDIVLSVVMLLNFVFYWYYSLLAFIRAIKSSFAPNGLVDYLTFSSGYYLLAVSVLLPLVGRLSLSTSDHLGLFFIVYFSLYIILNYIGALIIQLIQALKICLSK